MSKSKKNTIDPDDIISNYGADCARWFMLSDSPPERDVIWTEAGVIGAARFIQRIWRLIHTAKERVSKTNVSQPPEFCKQALKLRRSSHRTLKLVEENIEELKFNVSVAHLHDFVNQIQSISNQRGKGLDWAIREAIEILIQIINPMMPHLAEECWAKLGYKTLLVEQPWPNFDKKLVIDDNITIAVQINGKRKDEIEIERTLNSQEIKNKVLQLRSISRALDGKTPKKIIVIPDRVVNIVVS